MKIGSISNNTSFRSIYQVVAQKKDMQELRLLVADQKKASRNPAMIYNLTYHPATPKAISEKLDGRQFCVIVTGEDSLEKTSDLAGTDLSSFLVASSDKLINLSKNVKKDAVEILQAIKNNR